MADHTTTTAPEQRRTRQRSTALRPRDVPTRPFVNVLVGLGVSIALLYWAKAVVIPVALAVRMTFLLTPMVNALWRWGLGRTPHRA